MKKTLGTYEAADLLFNDENAGWTAAGSIALVEYLEELEEDLDEEIDFDIVGLRCEFSEYESLVGWIMEHYGTTLEEAFKSAGVDLEGDEEEQEVDDLIRDHILDNGQLIEFEGGVIVSSF